jgi:hypothetical protein
MQGTKPVLHVSLSECKQTKAVKQRFAETMKKAFEGSENVQVLANRPATTLHDFMKRGHSAKPVKPLKNLAPANQEVLNSARFSFMNPVSEAQHTEPNAPRAEQTAPDPVPTSPTGTFMPFAQKLMMSKEGLKSYHLDGSLQKKKENDSSDQIKSPFFSTKLLMRTTSELNGDLNGSIGQAPQISAPFRERFETSPELPSNRGDLMKNRLRQSLNGYAFSCDTAEKPSRSGAVVEETNWRLMYEELAKANREKDARIENMKKKYESVLQQKQELFFKKVQECEKLGNDKHVLQQELERMKFLLLDKELDEESSWKHENSTQLNSECEELRRQLQAVDQRNRMLSNELKEVKAKYALLGGIKGTSATSDAKRAYRPHHASLNEYQFSCRDPHLSQSDWEFQSIHDPGMLSLDHPLPR